jgi:hypothetical protein
MPEEQLEGYKKMFGREFPMYFEAEFITTGGNVFELEEIQLAEQLGKKYVDYTRPNRRAPKSMGIDPGFGSSKFAIVITQQVGDRVELLFAQEYDRGSPIGLIETAWELDMRYGTNKIYIDGANPGYVRDLKRMHGDDTKYEGWVQYAAKQKVDPDVMMKVVPVYFGKKGRELLGHVQSLLHDGIVAISPDDQFQSLLRQMRGAIELNGGLDKTRNSMDSLDALRLALKYYRYNPKRDRKRNTL